MKTCPRCEDEVEKLVLFRGKPMCWECRSAKRSARAARLEKFELACEEGLAHQYDEGVSADDRTPPKRVWRTRQKILGFFF